MTGEGGMQIDGLEGRGKYRGFFSCNFVQG